MKKIFIVLSLLSVSSAHASVTLEEAFRSTLKENERVKEQRELTSQADDRIGQVTGGLFPQLTFNAQHFMQPSPGVQFEQFAPPHQTTLNFNVTQPLFRGLREFAGIRKARHMRDGQSASEEWNRLLLFQEVAASYLQVLTYEQDLRNLRAQSKVYADRSQEMQTRRKRGESSRSEALSAESAEASLLAELRMVEGQLEAAREYFSFLTGLPADSKLASPDGVVPKTLPTLEECLKNAGERYDVKSAMETFKAAEAAVSLAWGAHLPSLDAGANYYLLRPGFNKDVNWDVNVRLVVPLFEGGATSAGVRLAVSEKSVAELRLERTKRSALQEIRSAHSKLRARIDHLEKLRRSVSLSTENVKVLQTEFKRGLARNLDVQLALSESRVANRGFDQASFAAQLEYYQLQIASAQIPAPLQGALK